MSDKKLHVGQLIWMARGNPQHPEMNRATPLIVICDDGSARVCALMQKDGPLAGLLGNDESIEFVPRELIYEDKETCLGEGMAQAMKIILELQEQGLAPMCDCDVHKRN